MPLQLYSSISNFATVPAVRGAVSSAKKASSPRPESSTLNPQPSTLNTQPSTLNPQPSILKFSQGAVSETCKTCPAGKEVLYFSATLRLTLLLLYSSTTDTLLLYNSTTDTCVVSLRSSYMG